MRKLMIYLMFLISSNIFCQSIQNTAVEIYFGTTNVKPSSKKITLHIIAQGTVWGGTSVPQKTYWISNDLNSLDYTPSTNNNLYTEWSGWDFILSNDFIDNGQFGCGLYKVFSDTDPTSYFYLDFRDDNYGSYTGSTGHNADIWLEYNGSNDAIYISNDPSSLGFPDNPISNGKILRIWELKGQGTPSTDEFPNFWQNSLAIITQEYNNNINLVWGPHPTFTATNYYVYRAAHTQPTIPRFRNYELIGITSDTVFSFIDIEAQLDQGNWYFYYYIKAYDSNTSSFSSPSNTVESSGTFTPYKNNGENVKDINYSFHLYQNYPNPFNPSTTISYYIPKSSFVTLKVYDILGKETAVLVKERQEAGNNTVEFTAAGSLPSGLYLYKITAGNYNASKKMMVMK